MKKYKKPSSNAVNICTLLRLFVEGEIRITIFKMINNRPKRFIWLLAVSFLITFIMGSMVFSQPTDAGTYTDRIAGADRYQTAVSVSQKGWKTSDYAVLARGNNFADALCAGPLAHKYGGPILLTQPNQLNNYTLAELKRLGVKHLFIAGGTGAVSQSVENALKAAGIQNVERIYGADRYETSVKIAKKVGLTGTGSIYSGKVVLATGSDFPDALSVSGMAAKLGMPILLTGKDVLPTSVSSYFQANTITQTFVVGGTGVISSQIQSTVLNPIRLAGADRYGTNTEVLKHFAGDLSYETVYLATGLGFADALTGAVLSAKSSSPLILTDKALPQGTADYVNGKLLLSSKVLGLGGRSVVPSTVITQLMTAKELLAAQEKYTKAGTYGPETGTKTIQGSVIINAADVTLRNTIIEGDLLLGRSIGDGDVTLRDVTVHGKTIVNGGGPNSIIMYNFNGITVIVDVPDGASVRLVAQGSTSVGTVSMEGNGTLEESKLTGAGFVTIVIPARAQVILSGDFDQVNIEAAGVNVTVQSGTINTLNVNAQSNVSGQGQITNANIHTSDVTIEQTPTNTMIALGLTANVGGELLSGTTALAGGGDSVPRQATPTFSPEAGAITFGTALEIISAEADAIFYTIDGTNPQTAAGGSTYLYDEGNKPVIDAAITVKAIAVKQGLTNSLIGSAAYTQAEANIDDLIISGNPSGYSFIPNVYAYEGVTVPYAVGSITLTPTGTGRIIIEATEVTSGASSAAISLIPGVERTIILEVEQLGKMNKSYTIKITREINHEADILTYSFTQQTGPATIDAQNGTILIEVRFGTARTNLNASFTTSDDIQSIQVNGSNQISGSTGNNFTSPVTYVVTAQNGVAKTWVVTVNVEPEFAGGNGEDGSPYRVATADQLNRVRHHLSKSFIQVADIDLTDYSSGAGWNPIGGFFTGKYDGGGYKITNLKINRPEMEHVGLFSQLNHISARLTNIHLENIDITGLRRVGGVVGGNWGGNISHCSSSGRVIALERVAGGLIGGNYSQTSIVSSSHSSAQVSATWGVGGFVGWITYGTFIDSYATGDVTGESFLGGFAGMSGNHISGCFATGNVTMVVSERLASYSGGYTAGGLVGFVEAATFTTATVVDSYATGSVTAPHIVGQMLSVGGLVGRFAWKSFGDQVSNSYSIGHVTCNQSTHGLIGHANLGAIVTGCFYDSDKSGYTDEKATPLTTLQMLKKDSFTDWPFSDDETIRRWRIIEDVSYPYLSWQIEHIPLP